MLKHGLFIQHAIAMLVEVICPEKEYLK